MGILNLTLRGSLGKRVIYKVKEKTCFTQAVISYICKNFCSVHLIFAVFSNVSGKNEISGYCHLGLI